MVWNHEQNILCLTTEVLYMRKRMKENLFGIFQWALKYYRQNRSSAPPQDSINELIIWKINLLVVPVTNVKFKSELLHAKWVVNNLRELVCIWSDWKSLNELKFLEDIYIKFRETKLVEISWLNRVWIHGSLRMQECRDESEIYNCQQTQLSNKKIFLMEFWGVHLTWLDCNNS